jgi:nucleotidyltransferase/DNA polymerase involved in DNA repair
MRQGVELPIDTSREFINERRRERKGSVDRILTGLRNDYSTIGGHAEDKEMSDLLTQTIEEVQKLDTDLLNKEVTADVESNIKNHINGLADGSKTPAQTAKDIQDFIEKFSN